MARRLVLIALTLAAVLVPAAPAAARAVLGEKIVVSAPDGARAVIERSPLRIAWFDAGGRKVLEQVAPGAGPFAVGLGLQNQYGLASPPTPTAYRPFGFLVGTHEVAQHEAIPQWRATLQNVGRSGTVHGATEIVAAARSGAGVDLTLATDDPTGRVLRVRIAPRGRTGLTVQARPEPAAGVAAMADSFSSDREAFRGFGGRHNYLDQRGRQFFNWLQQQNVSSGSGESITAPTNPESDRYLFPNGEAAAYYVHSAFVSDAGYGFLLDRDEISEWRMASDRADAWQVEVAGTALDYTVLPGTLRRSVAAVSALNGRHRVPPAWALGSMMVRAVRFPGDNAANYLADVRDDIRQIKATGIPVDAYGIEGWEFLDDGPLRDVIGELKALGIKPMLYYRLFVGEDEIGTDDPADYDTALANGWVATRADGSPYTFTSNFFASAAMIDFTDPGAVRWWRSRIRAGLRMGAKGFMQDFGEQVMQDMRFDDGSTGRTMHNRLPVLAHRATRAELDRWKRRTGEEIFFYTRAGYSGTPGSAAYENANFAGDSTTDWTRSAGLASLATDMLNRAVAGNYGYTTDIGGYFDIGPYESPTSKQLFLRWTEWAALSPLFRLHGSVRAGTHMPWTYDRETVDLYRRYARLHLAARPYLRALWRRAVRSGTPPVRPLWLEFPGDAEAAAQDQQWMLGPYVLVAPVVIEDARSRRVYFPRGCWRHGGTGRRYQGPGYQDVPAPVGELPWFLRCDERSLGAARKRL